MKLACKRKHLLRRERKLVQEKSCAITITAKGNHVASLAAWKLELSLWFSFPGKGYLQDLKHCTETSFFLKPNPRRM